VDGLECLCIIVVITNVNQAPALQREAIQQEGFPLFFIRQAEILVHRQACIEYIAEYTKNKSLSEANIALGAIQVKSGGAIDFPITLFFRGKVQP
jgi:hypothetical protein